LKKIETVKSDKGKEIDVDQNLIPTTSIVFDAVFVPGGKNSVKILKKNDVAINLLMKHLSTVKQLGL
jgi:catalase